MDLPVLDMISPFQVVTDVILDILVL